MAATEIILGLLFLYPTFREIQKTLKKKKAREIACWFESYAQSTLSFEKFETEMGKDAVRKLEKINAKYGTTMLIVTHNNAIKNMVHKVIIVKDGLIKKDYLNETRIPAAELEDL